MLNVSQCISQSLDSTQTPMITLEWPLWKDEKKKVVFETKL